jgi:hypothetical protein
METAASPGSLIPTYEITGFIPQKALAFILVKRVLTVSNNLR